jgi:hypothetical protein
MLLPMTPDLLDEHGRPTPATTFLLVHRALRRDLVLLRAAAAAASEPDDGQVGWVLERWGVFRRVLTDHHRSEDERLFPALRAAEPGLGPVLAVLDAEHAGLDAALDRAEAALDALPAGAGEAAAEIAVLARDLDAHLAREEEHLVPVMLRGGGGPPAGGGGPDEAVRRWVAEGLEPAVVAALTR